MCIKMAKNNTLTRLYIQEKADGDDMMQDTRRRINDFSKDVSIVGKSKIATHSATSTSHLYLNNSLFNIMQD